MDDSPEAFFILSNKNGNENFALYKTNFVKTKDIYWKKIISHKNNELIEDFLCFKDFIILETRKGGLTQLLQFNRRTNKKIYLSFKDNSYSVNLINNNDYNASSFSFHYSSLNLPPIIYSQDLYTKKEKNLESESIEP